jgi:hypothetical protein
LAGQGIIAHLADRFQRHVSGPLHCPFIVLFEQDCADEAHDGIVVGEDSDDLCASLDLAVETFDGICRVELGAMLLRKVM